MNRKTIENLSTNRNKHHTYYLPNTSKNLWDSSLSLLCFSFFGLTCFGSLYLGMFKIVVAIIVQSVFFLEIH